MLTKAEIYDPKWMRVVGVTHYVKPEWHAAVARSSAGKYDALPAVPSIVNIHTKVFEAASAPGALDMRNWHTCGTTHCRAGWVVHLAGEAGYDLERRFGPSGAALLIYRASDPNLILGPWPFVVRTEQQTLADMRACAEREAAQITKLP